MLPASGFDKRQHLVLAFLGWRTRVRHSLLRRREHDRVKKNPGSVRIQWYNKNVNLRAHNL